MLGGCCSAGAPSSRVVACGDCLAATSTGMSIRKPRSSASAGKKCRSRSTRPSCYPCSTSSWTTRASSSFHIARAWSPVSPPRVTRCRRSGGSNPLACRRSPFPAIARCCSVGCRTSRHAASPEAIAIARKSIVTKTGDGGETGLLYGGRVSKTDPRTEAYGAVDEAISALGVARALIKDRGRHAIILRGQSELFTVGAELATDAAEYSTLQRHFKVVTADFTTRCEAEIADLEGRITLPAAFVIPGGTQPAAALDVARAVVRRAERRIVGLQQSGHLLNAEVLRYVNRLSDLLFMLARAEEGTTVKPLTGRRAGRTPAAPAPTPRAPTRRPRG